MELIRKKCYVDTGKNSGKWVEPARFFFNSENLDSIWSHVSSMTPAFAKAEFLLLVTKENPHQVRLFTLPKKEADLLALIEKEFAVDYSLAEVSKKFYSDIYPLSSRQGGAVPRPSRQMLINHMLNNPGSETCWQFGNYKVFLDTSHPEHNFRFVDLCSLY